MTDAEPVPTRAHRARSTGLAGLVVVGAVVVGALMLRPPAAPSATAPTFSASPDDARAGQRPGSRGAGGAVREGVTVSDDHVPAVARLDADLLRALREAAGDAADDGIELYVNSGWRSATYQDQLFRQAVAEYGSEEEAARWVATAATSSHVSGEAVDIGDSDATAWLSDHGAEYGLCQIYDNEPWHYELRPEADDDGCPARYADPTHDPRMS